MRTQSFGNVRNDGAGDLADARGLGDAAGFFRRVQFADDVATSGKVTVAAASPSAADEVSFLNGINPDGTITSDSYWGETGRTAYKWGSSTAGTGATITYFFQANSNWTANEKATFLKAFEMWGSVANLTFEEASSQNSAGVLIRRGNDGGAYNSTPATRGSGDELGRVNGQSLISVDTRTLGFEADGSFDTVGGYGLSTIIHEVGHMLGMGHGGDYNGAVNPATQQYSAYDERMYTIMSYVFYNDTDAKYAAENPNTGTDWGVTDDGYLRQAPHSIQQLDILAIQQLYGVSTTTPFDGGEIYGFNTNITGLLRDFYDFTVNTDPVVTLYNAGTGNTLDLSGYAMAQNVDLRSGAFSDIAGHDNNVSIAAGTIIETAIGGRGADTIQASDVASSLFGGKGNDVLFGGAGADLLNGGAGTDSLSGFAGKDTMTGGTSADTFLFYTVAETAKKAGTADVIADFSSAQGDKVNLSAIDAISGTGDNAFTFIGNQAFSNTAGELRFTVVDGDTLVSGDVDGNGKADFMIRLEDITTVVALDFIL